MKWSRKRWPKCSPIWPPENRSLNYLASTYSFRLSYPPLAGCYTNAILDAFNYNANGSNVQQSYNRIVMHYLLQVCNATLILASFAAALFMCPKIKNKIRSWTSYMHSHFHLVLNEWKEWGSVDMKTFRKYFLEKNYET